MKRNDYLIKRKFYQYLVPGVMMIVAMQLGNVVDGIIVGNILGSSALSAISLSIPVLYVLQFPAFVLGVGGAAQASVLLGKRDVKGASRTLSVCVTAGVAVSLLFVVTAPFVSHPLSVLLAGTDELVALLEPYVFVNILGIPFLSLAIIMSNFINVDNNPALGSAMFIIANCINLVLDLVFLNFTELGMYGSAMATIIGYTCGLVVIIPYSRSKNRMLKFSKHIFSGKKMLGLAIKAGVPSAMFLLMSAVKALILNSGVVRILGTEQMNIYSICTNSVLIAELFVGGIIGLIPTIAGILYGEKDYYGIRRLVKKVLVFSTSLVIVLIAVFLLFPQLIAGLFGMHDSELLPLTQTCLRIYCLSFVFYIFNKFTQTYYQTILQPSPATLSTVLQGLVLLIPLTFLMLGLWGISGVCIAAVVSEALTLLCVMVYRIIMQKLKKLPQKGILLIPDEDSGNFCDFTITGTEEQAVGVSQKLIDYCLAQNIDKRNANIIGLAAEEIAVNISRYGYQNIKRSYIDINLSYTDGKLILRVRDDGAAFNPTEYTPEEEGKFQLGGINLLQKLTTKLSYIRVLNMNNTVIELDANKLLSA